MHLLWSAAIPVPADASLHWFSHASGYLLPVMRALDALDVLPGKLRAIAAHVEAELRASLEAPPLPRRDKFLAYVVSALREGVPGSPSSVPRPMQVSELRVCVWGRLGVRGDTCGQYMRLSPCTGDMGLRDPSGRHYARLGSLAESPTEAETEFAKCQHDPPRAGTKPTTLGEILGGRVC